MRAPVKFGSVGVQLFMKPILSRSCKHKRAVNLLGVHGHVSTCLRYRERKRECKKRNRSSHRSLLAASLRWDYPHQVPGSRPNRSDLSRLQAALLVCLHYSILPSSYGWVPSLSRVGFRRVVSIYFSMKELLKDLVFQDDPVNCLKCWSTLGVF